MKWISLCTEFNVIFRVVWTFNRDGNISSFHRVYLHSCTKNDLGQIQVLNDNYASCMDDYYNKFGKNMNDVDMQVKTR